VPEGTIPSVKLTGVNVKIPPLHVDAVRLLTAGVGFTVTVTVKFGPVHDPATGVTV